MINSTSFSANNFALKSNRKTLSAGDVFSALEDMEFQEFVPELKECLEGNETNVYWLLQQFSYLCIHFAAYRQEQKGKKEAAADRKKKVQSLSSSTELGRILSDAVTSSSDSQTLAGEQDRQTLPQQYT